MDNKLVHFEASIGFAELVSGLSSGLSPRGWRALESGLNRPRRKQAGCCCLQPSATLKSMESKLAKEAERELVAATQRLSPEQRLNAFLEHCQLVTELYEAGQKMRTDASQAHK